ncbi:MAG TPA: hypothetical protein VFA07_02970 [Chthonomonadaceae bacterium]|nr:hypothetical protein [Chthonomonadaceae bacterium]
MALGICLLLVLLLIGLGVYIARGNWMYVIRVDEQGNRIGKGQWARSPKPTVVQQNGLEVLEHYIARMLGSRKPIRALIISTLDQQGGFLLTARDNQVTIGLNVERRQEPKREQAIRQLFQDLGITPTRDYLAMNGLVPDSTRILEYPLPNSEEGITEISKRVLQEIYSVHAEDGLSYTYEENV